MTEQRDTIIRKYEAELAVRRQMVREHRLRINHIKFILRNTYRVGGTDGA